MIEFIQATFREGCLLQGMNIGHFEFASLERLYVWIHVSPGSIYLTGYLIKLMGRNTKDAVLPFWDTSPVKVWFLNLN